jgi:phosphonate transport system substrate-binding protein
VYHRYIGSVTTFETTLHHSLQRRCLLGWLGALSASAWPAPVMAQAAASSAPVAPPLPARGTALVFGLITPRDAQQIVAAWTPFLQRIGSDVGREVVAWPAPNSGELVAAFKAGRIDLAWIGNAPALEIVESGIGEVFAQMVTGDGHTGYRSIFVTHKDSGLRSLEDVLRPGRGLVFGDGELKSTSGHLVPLYYAFIKRGINEPKALFAEVRHGSHRNNMLSAARREVHVATTNDVELELFRAEQPETAAALRVIWESPTIPQSPLMWSTRLPIELRRRLQEVVVGFGKRGAAEAAILRGVNDLSGFRKSRNSQLITVADVEMFAAWQQVNNDPRLSAGDKVERAQAISRRASRLELRLRLPPSVQ